MRTLGLPSYMLYCMMSVLEILPGQIRSLQKKNAERVSHYVSILSFICIMLVRQFFKIVLYIVFFSSFTAKIEV